MKKLLKTVSLSSLILFVTVLLTGCGEKKVNVDDFYFPVLNNTTWEGEVISYGEKSAYVEFVFENNGKGFYTLTEAGNDPLTGKFTYIIMGTILQLRNVPEMLDQPWSLVKVEDRMMLLEGTPNKDHFKPTLSISRR